MSTQVHYKPKDMATYWPYQQKDVWLAVPPGWDSKPLRDDGTPGERWAGAFLTHDSVVVQGMADRLATSKKGLPDKVKRNLAAAHPAPAPNNHKRARLNSRIDPELLKKAHEAALAAGEEPVKRQGPSLSQVAPKNIPKEHTGEDLDDDDDDGDDAEEARKALKRPEGRTLKKSSSRSRVVPARRRGRRRDDDDDAAPRPKKAEEDDDEVEVVVGGSLLLMGFGWWFGGISLVSLTLCLRRAVVTRGRSLDPRRLGRKEKAELPL